MGRAQGQPSSNKHQGEDHLTHPSQSYSQSWPETAYHPRFSYYQHVQQYLVPNLADPLISSAAQGKPLQGFQLLCLSPMSLLMPPTDPDILNRVSATKPSPHRSSCNLSYMLPVLETDRA